jgi:spore germination protein GerM
MKTVSAEPRSGRVRRGARAFGLVLGGLILAVLAWAAWRWSVRSGEVTVVDPAASDTAGTGFRSARLWFVARSGDSLVSEPREIIEQTGLHERVAALLDELVRGPTGAGLTLLPAGTTLRHAYLDERGLLTLDLSGAFRSGFRGGAGAEELALATLLRTLGDNLPEVRRVTIVCEGTPLVSLGGHLPLDRPLDLAEWP